LTNVADYIVDALIEFGIRTVFAMPGDQLSPLFKALAWRSSELRVIHPRNEQSAVCMAYGYARVTGNPSVVIVPPGPGVLNAMTGMAIGYATSTPILMIAGQLPSYAIGKGLGLLHELPDQLSHLKGVTKWAACVQSPEESPKLLREAFEQMLTGRPRSVALEFPPDILAATLSQAIQKLQLRSQTLDQKQLNRAADLLKQAQRPLIIAGGGAVDAADSLMVLADKFQAPVISNSGGRGIVPDQSYLSFTWPGGHRLWKNADVVLAVGTRFSQPSALWGLDDAIRVIRIDIDPEELSKLREFDIQLLGEALQAVKELIELTGDYRAPSREEELSSLKSVLNKEFRQLSPQYEYLSALRESLPEDGILVDELNQIGYACRFSFPVLQPRTYVTSGYQGALGYGFPAALGAKAAHPHRAVLSVNGDGGFMYGASELSTAVQQRLGVVAVVFNDNCFGNIARDQKSASYSIATELHNPDIVSFAESFGVSGKRAYSPTELRYQIEAALNRDLPTVIEVPVDEMPSPWHFIRLPRIRGQSNQMQS
jgi:acetolactate synthase-1/2/3 large subunit